MPTNLGGKKAGTPTGGRGRIGAGEEVRRCLRLPSSVTTDNQATYQPNPTNQPTEDEGQIGGLYVYIIFSVKLMD